MVVEVGIFSLLVFSLIIFKLLSLLIVKIGSRSFANFLSGDITNCHIIVPVYNEQNTIVDSVKRWSAICHKLPIQVHFACTDREDKENGDSTYKLAKLNVGHKNIFVHSAPASRINMAGQINYVIENLDDYDVVGIYNVDSIVKYSDLKWNFQKALSSKCIVQQYGMYFGNRSVEKCVTVLEYFTYWQTTWSILFEIRNLFLNELIKKYSLPKIMNKFSYVVGHGLYLPSIVIDQLGKLPEDKFNEDMYFSTIIHDHDAEVIVGKGYSVSSTASSLSSLLNQQMVWSTGPMMAFSYPTRNSISIFKKLAVRLKLFLHFVYWAFGPLFFFIGFLTSNSITLNLALLYSYFALAYLPGFFILKRYEFTNINFIWDFIWAAPITYILHSFGPIMRILKLILRVNPTLNYHTEK